MKKIVAIILCVLIVLGLCGRTKVDSKNLNPMTKITVIVDDETGVEYVVYAGFNRGGICPRYNADGTLRVRGENMIALDVENYCHSCPDFEAKCQKVYSDGDVCMTIVECESKHKCKRLKQYIEQQIRKDNK